MMACMPQTAFSLLYCRGLQDGAMHTPPGTNDGYIRSASPTNSTVSHANYVGPDAAMTAGLLSANGGHKGPRGSGHSQGSSLGETPSMQSFGAAGGSGGDGTVRRPGTTGSTAIDSNQLASLLRHRSSGGLAGVEVGPLLGRGSYGRVYKGA